MQGIAKRNGYETYEDYRNSLDAWKAYKLDVWRTTNQQPLHLLENYDKRGVNGEEGAYTLDHIESIRKGFNNNIPPEQIGQFSNLQMLPWLDNITKRPIKHFFVCMREKRVESFGKNEYSKK